MRKISLYTVGYTAPSAMFTDISTHWAIDSIDYVVGIQPTEEGFYYVYVDT